MIINFGREQWAKAGPSLTVVGKLGAGEVEGYPVIEQARVPGGPHVSGREVAALFQGREHQPGRERSGIAGVTGVLGKKLAGEALFEGAVLRSPIARGVEAGFAKDADDLGVELG